MRNTTGSGDGVLGIEYVILREYDSTIPFIDFSVVCWVCTNETLAAEALALISYETSDSLVSGCDTMTIVEIIFCEYEFVEFIDDSLDPRD